MHDNPSSSVLLDVGSADGLPAGASAHIRADGVSVARGARRVLHDVSITVSHRSRLAVVGENGRGKTTLLHVLAGLLAPDSGPGHAHRHRGHGPAAADRPVRRDRRDPDLGRAARLAGRAGRPGHRDAGHDRGRRRLRRPLRGRAGRRDPPRRVGRRAPGGRRSRGPRGLHRPRPRAGHPVGGPALPGAAGLPARGPARHPAARRTHQPPRRRWAGLPDPPAARANGGFALVSHDRALLRDVADQFLDLDPSQDGRARLYAGGYDAWQDERRRDRERWRQDHEEQQDEHRRLTDAVARARNRLSTGWRPEKGTDRHQRQSRAPGVVQALHRQQDALEAHPITVPPPPLALRWPDLGARTGASLLRAVDVEVAGRLDGPVSLTHRIRRPVAGDRGERSRQVHPAVGAGRAARPHRRFRHRGRTGRGSRS